MHGVGRESTSRRLLSQLRNQWAGFLALFLVLTGGTAWALSQNSVGSREIKPKAVRGSDIANNAVTSPKVADRSLRKADFAEGQLPAGPDEPSQLLDKLKTVDTDTSGLNADTVDGKNADALASGRIHTIGSSPQLEPLLPGLSYEVNCPTGGFHVLSVRFWPQPAASGTANALVVAEGVETPTADSNTVNVQNGAQDQGFPFSDSQQVWVSVQNDTGVARAEIQLIMDIGSRTYSVAMHIFERASDGYCETIGTATVAQ
jgi:hypothetical protein